MDASVDLAAPLQVGPQADPRVPVARRAWQGGAGSQRSGRSCS